VESRYCHLFAPRPKFLTYFDAEGVLEKQIPSALRTPAIQQRLQKSYDNLTQEDIILLVNARFQYARQGVVTSATAAPEGMQDIQQTQGSIAGDAGLK
jgi:hypothetical protein